MVKLRLLPLLLLIGLTIPGESWAKKKEKKDAAEKTPSKKKVPKLIGGSLPPLPASTGATLNFEGDSAETAVYATAVSGADSANAASAATPQVASWTIANWREQMAEDIKRIQARKKKIGKKLVTIQRQDFVVAVRYLRGTYDSAAQFHRLSQQVLAEFNDAFPSDRNTEASPQPPEAARRVRLYLDKVVGLDQASDVFIERTTKERKESIVLIKEE